MSQTFFCMNLRFTDDDLERHHRALLHAYGQHDPLRKVLSGALGLHFHLGDGEYVYSPLWYADIPKKWESFILYTDGCPWVTLPDHWVASILAAPRVTEPAATVPRNLRVCGYLERL